MDLVDHDSVPGGDEIVLKPAPGNTGGHDDDVPTGRLRSRLPFPIHHSDRQRSPENRLGDGPYAQGLSGPGSCHDPESLSGCRQLTHIGTMLALEDRIEMQSKSELDGFTGRPGGRDHDDAACGMGCVAVSVGIGGKMMVARGMHAGR